MVLGEGSFGFSRKSPMTSSNKLGEVLKRYMDIVGPTLNNIIGNKCFLLSLPEEPQGFVETHVQILELLYVVIVREFPVQLPVDLLLSLPETLRVDGQQEQRERHGCGHGLGDNISLILICTTLNK